MDNSTLEDETLKETNNNSAGRIMADSFLGSKKEKNQSDINNINDKIGHNEPVKHLTDNNKDDKDGNSLDDNDTKKKKNNDLEDRDSDDKNKDSNKSDDGKDKKNKESNDNKNESKDDKESEDGNILTRKAKQKLRRIKLFITIAIASAGIFFIILIFTIIVTAVDSFISSITEFFTGDVSENQLSDEEIDKATEMIEEDFDCSSDSSTTVCKLIKMVNEETSGKNVDKNLIISTIMNGFDSKNTNEESSNLQSIENLLKDDNGFITKDNVKKITDASTIKTLKVYYKWSIETVDGGKIGKCSKIEDGQSQFSMDKWKVYMRFGEKASNEYEKMYTLSTGKELNSKECDGSMTDSELIELVKSATSDSQDYSVDTNSVEVAKEAINNINVDVFLQHANVNDTSKDEFTSFNDLTFDYKNGFVYEYFPSFKSGYTYDEVKTPKDIEKIIEKIINKKDDSEIILSLSD